MLSSLKKLQIAWIATLFVALAQSNFVLADFICSSDVIYAWTANQSPSLPVATAGGAATPSQTFFGKIEARAESEELAKKALATRVGAAKTQAIARCKREHENLSGCVAAKYSAMGTTLNTLTFSARKALEDAINTDCEHQSGICGQASVAEAECREEVKAAEPTPDAAKGGDKKADKKK